MPVSPPGSRIVTCVCGARLQLNTAAECQVVCPSCKTLLAVPGAMASAPTDPSADDHFNHLQTEIPSSPPLAPALPQRRPRTRQGPPRKQLSAGAVIAIGLGALLLLGAAVLTLTAVLTSTKRPAAVADLSADLTNDIRIEQSGDVDTNPANFGSQTQTPFDGAAQAGESPHPDSVPGRLVVLDESRYGDKLGRPLIVDRDNGIFGLSVISSKGGRTFSSLHLADLAAGTAKRACVMNDHATLLDHDLASGLSLLWETSDTSRRGRLSLMANLTSGAGQRVHSLTIEHKHITNIGWAKIVDPATVVGATNEMCFVWSIREQRIKATVPLKFDTAAALHPSGNLVAIPMQDGAQLLDVASGELTKTIPFPGDLPHVSFHPDGSRLCLSDDYIMRIWDVRRNQLIADHHTPLRISGQLRWIGPDLYITQDGCVGQLGTALMAWRYGFGRSQTSLGENTNDGILYASVVDGLTLENLQIPHPIVQSAIERAATMTATQQTRDECFAMTPGSKVKLRVQPMAPVTEQEMEEIARTMIQRAGWVEDPTASATLTVSFTNGPSEQVRYGTIRESMSMESNVAPTTVAMFLTTLKVEIDGKQAWERVKKSRAPSFVAQSSSQTKQQAVSQASKPKLRSLKALTLPPYIPREKYRDGLGVSSRHQGEWQHHPTTNFQGRGLADTLPQE